MSLRRVLTNILWGADAVDRARLIVERSAESQAVILATDTARIERAAAAIQAQLLFVRARHRRTERLGYRAVANALAHQRRAHGSSAARKPAQAHLQMASSRDFPG